MKYPYFNEDEDFEMGDNFTNLEKGNKLKALIIKLKILPFQVII